MGTMSQTRQDMAELSHTFASQYETLLEGWAEVSRCYLEAADDICKTGLNYCRDQAERFRDMAFDPANATREQTYTSMIGSSIDAADRIGHACLESFEHAREPLIRLVSSQVPLMSRTIATGVQDIARSAEEMRQAMASTQAAMTSAVEEETRIAEEAASAAAATTRKEAGEMKEPRESRERAKETRESKEHSRKRSAAS